MRRPPPDGPEGTVWFGGPVDRFSITLRIFGDELDPDEISRVLGCAPTKSARKGAAANSDLRIAKTGRWSLTVKSRDLDPDSTFEDILLHFLGKLPSDPDLWTSLTKNFNVGIFCGLILEAYNQGFGISTALRKMLAERNLKIGFDLYFEPQIAG